jgi:hypothetical protein
MRAPHLHAVVTCGAILAVPGASAQTASAAPPPAAAAEQKAWSVSATAFAYFLRDEPDYLQPSLVADKEQLHLEARYNYEGRKTGSIWVGRNWSFGENVTFDVTPMLGAVFGDTSGMAPGYKASLAWRKLELSSESEYVFDTGGSADNFFYTWSELGWSPSTWLRLGLVVQRTKVYRTEFDIQRGLFLGVTWRKANLTTYVFNVDGSRPTLVMGLGVDF